MIQIRDNMTPVFSGSFPSFCYSKLSSLVKTNYSYESDGNQDFFCDSHSTKNQALVSQEKQELYRTLVEQYSVNLVMADTLKEQNERIRIGKVPISLYKSMQFH